MKRWIQEQHMTALKEVTRLNKKLPYISITIILIIVLSCIFSKFVIPYNPKYMNLAEISQAPGIHHIFGTDTLGRDIFSMILHGGRISLAIGFFATIISTMIAAIYGCISGMANEIQDNLLMRFTEILMSIPQILLVIFIQAMFGNATVLSISVVIALTSWMQIAKMVRSEVKQIRNSDYILAARTMGADFFYILWNHLWPNFMPTIMFMIVSNIGSAIALEATLSFLGIGLPTNIISWGTLMGLSQKAVLSGFWWLLIIPGTIMALTIICITEIGEFIRTYNKRDSLL